jgi:Flp pilus assembly protein TadB
MLPFNLISFVQKKSVPGTKKRPRSRKSELEEQLELARSKKREAERMAAKLQREIDEVPMKLKKLEEDERRKIKERAKKSPTIQGLGRPTHRLQVTDGALKLTRGQRRAMRNRLILLCVGFAVILFILWKSIR